MMKITDKELNELANKEAKKMWGDPIAGKRQRSYFVTAYKEGFKEALKQVENNGVLGAVSKPVCADCGGRGQLRNEREEVVGICPCHY